MTGHSQGWRPKWRRMLSQMEQTGLADIFSFIVLALLALRCGSIGVQRADALVNAEGAALSSFKDAITSDPKNVFRTWNTGDATPCSWTGVTCDAGSRVTRLLLNGAGLTGSISGSLSQLTLLRTLSLSRNSLTGVIPADLSTMGALYKLNLSHNALSGSIPGTLGNLTSLRMMDLSGNSFSGPLSSQLFQDCRKLRYIDLSQNGLSGTIPTALGSCYSLSGIDFFSNKLQGTIPEELGRLRELNWLSLEQNLLFGRIPNSLGNCSALQVLSLGGNSLFGVLPDELGVLGALSSLGLQENFLTGNVSPSIVFKPSMVHVNLSSNLFSGSIPVVDRGGSCSKLQVLDFSANNFSGPIPSSLGSYCLDLLDLRLSSNQLSSSIPLSLNQLGNLQVLDLSLNYLTGTVPPQVGSLSKLTSLRLNGNPISGFLPVEIHQMGKLQLLHLQSMKLNGSLPSSMGMLVSLSNLDLSENYLTGVIPESLSALANLTELNLSLNTLNGSIPTELGSLAKLRDLNLSNNSFTGTIPSTLGSISHLQHFNISFNNLTGSIPLIGSLAHFNSSSYLGNPALCGPPLNILCAGTFSPLVSPAASPGEVSGGGGGRSTRKTHLLSTSSIIAISAAAFIAIAVLIVTLMNVRAVRKRRHGDVLVYESSSPPQNISPIVGKLVLFSKSLPSRYEDWEAGTKALLGGECMIGKGSLGAVFKATFDGGLSIAVKKLDTLGRIKNQDDFEHEMGVLGNLKPHPNLVPLQGYYWSSAMQLLLTDFITNDSLFNHLHGQPHSQSSSDPRSSSSNLTWRRRFKIALGTARGLAYLHHDCKPPVYHFDLKVSNILLDDNFEARVTDYGLGKLLPMLDTYISSRKFHTTLGYVAPELACQSLRLTDKCDVYSFGMILLELVTGRPPVESFENNVIVLGEFVRTALEQAGGRLSTCVDPRLDPVPDSEIMQVLKLGLICTSQNPSKRPTMGEVVQVLESIKSSSNSSRTASAPTSASVSATGSVSTSP